MSNSKNFMLLIVGVIFLSFGIVGLIDMEEKPTSIVKNGTMYGYKAFTIEDAFNNSFTDGVFRECESPTGKIFVEFTGFVSEQLHENLDDIPVNTLVTFQWTMNIDKTFECTYIEGLQNKDATIFESYSIKEIMDAIYK